MDEVPVAVQRIHIYVVEPDVATLVVNAATTLREAVCFILFYAE